MANNYDDDLGLGSIYDLELSKLSDRMINVPIKKVKSKSNFEIIQKLEAGIRGFLKSGYSYMDVSEYLQKELNLTISIKTLRVYLNKLRKERENEITIANKAETKSTPQTIESPSSLNFDMPTSTSKSLKKVVPPVEDDSSDIKIVELLASNKKDLRLSVTNSKKQ